MSVYDKDGELVYEQSMLPPNELPGIAGRLGEVGDEFIFLEPELYDISVDGIIDFENNLEQLIEHATMKVQVSDDGWTENVNLPRIEREDENLAMITFSSTSSKPFYVNYGENRMKVKANGKMIFTYLNGNWENMYESAYVNAEAIRNFIINNNAASLKVIDKWKATIKNLEKDTDGSGVARLLDKYGYSNC